MYPLLLKSNVHRPIVRRILASRVIDSKMTVVVCPNDVVQQWGKSILEIFPDSVVTSGKDAFFCKVQQRQVFVLNSEL